MMVVAIGALRPFSRRLRSFVCGIQRNRGPQPAHDLTVAMLKYSPKRRLVAKLSRMLSRSLPRDKVKEF